MGEPLRAVVALIFSLSAGIASAQLVIQDWSSPGDGLIVHDSATGIDWLNLRATAGMSRNAVEGGLSTTFAGFQYAGAGNLGTFFSNAGISPVDVIGIGGSNPAVSGLLGSWGLLSSSPGSTFSQFLFASAIEVNPAGYLAQFSSPVVHWSANITAGGMGYGLGVSEAYLGSALMRGGTLDLSGDFGQSGGGIQPVPEPETYAMMLAGLGVLGVMARRRKWKDVSS